MIMGLAYYLFTANITKRLAPSRLIGITSSFGESGALHQGEPISKSQVSLTKKIGSVEKGAMLQLDIYPAFGIRVSDYGCHICNISIFPESLIADESLRRH